MAENRPSWDEYFLNMVDVVGTRSTCDRGKIGCVIVRDRRILATGYAGSPSGTDQCDTHGHQMKTVTHADKSQSEHCVRTIHSELSGLLQCARFGIATEGATVYVTMTPCINCAKALINAGIVKVIARKGYQTSSDTFDLFKQAGIEYTQIENEVQQYT